MQPSCSAWGASGVLRENISSWLRGVLPRGLRREPQAGMPVRPAAQSDLTYSPAPAASRKHMAAGNGWIWQWYSLVILFRLVSTHLSSCCWIWVSRMGLAYGLCIPAAWSLLERLVSVCRWLWSRRGVSRVRGDWTCVIYPLYTIHRLYGFTYMFLMRHQTN